MRAEFDESVTEVQQSWFEAGWQVGSDGVDEGACFPPLNDMEAQRSWLGGFGAAWAAVDASASVEAALAWVLFGRAELLRQLRSYRQGWASETMH